MKKNIVLLIALVFTLLPLTLNAQHEFKWRDPIKLVKEGKSPRGQSLGIAWSGSVYGIVYDDYWWNKTKTGTYLLIVNPNGQKVFGPKRLSGMQMGMDPKIVWAGDAFAILHPAGTKKGNDCDYKYYLARYSTAGKKLSQKTLDIIPTSDNDPIYGKLIWTGSEIGVFYYGNIPGQNIVPSHWFCKADSAGVPGESVRIVQLCYGQNDVAWDGKQYVFVGVRTYTSGNKKNGELRIFALDSRGNITTDEKYKNFADIDFFQGISIAASHKKSKYLLAIGIVRPGGQTAPAEAHWIDVFTTLMKVRKGKVSKFNPKNVTASQSDDWSYPTILRDGSNYYITALMGTAGSSFAFAKMNVRGKIKSNPLTFERPQPVCGCSPPYPVWDSTNKECGIAFIYEDLLFNIAQP